MSDQKKQPVRERFRSIESWRCGYNGFNGEEMLTDPLTSIEHVRIDIDEWNPKGALFPYLIKFLESNQHVKSVNFYRFDGRFNPKQEDKLLAMTTAVSRNPRIISVKLYLAFANDASVSSIIKSLKAIRLKSHSLRLSRSAETNVDDARINKLARVVGSLPKLRTLELINLSDRLVQKILSYAGRHGKSTMTSLELAGVTNLKGIGSFLATSSLHTLNLTMDAINQDSMAELVSGLTRTKSARSLHFYSNIKHFDLGATRLLANFLARPPVGTVTLGYHFAKRIGQCLFSALNLNTDICLSKLTLVDYKGTVLLEQGSPTAIQKLLGCNQSLTQHLSPVKNMDKETALARNAAIQTIAKRISNLSLRVDRNDVMGSSTSIQTIANCISGLSALKSLELFFPGGNLNGDFKSILDVMIDPDRFKRVELEKLNLVVHDHLEGLTTAVSAVLRDPLCVLKDLRIRSGRAQANYNIPTLLTAATACSSLQRLELCQGVASSQEMWHCIASEHMPRLQLRELTLYGRCGENIDTSVLKDIRQRFVDGFKLNHNLEYATIGFETMGRTRNVLRSCNGDVGPIIMRNKTRRVAHNIKNKNQPISLLPHAVRAIQNCCRYGEAGTVPSESLVASLLFPLLVDAVPLSEAAKTGPVDIVESAKRYLTSSGQN